MFFADRRRGELAAEALLLRPAIDVLLKVGQRQIRHRELLPERPSQMLEVELDSLQGGLFKTPVSMGFQVAIPQAAERYCRLIRGGFGWLAVELNKRDNIHAGRQVQEVLPKAHQEVIHLIRLGFRLVRGHLPDGEVVAFSMTSELAVPPVAFLLERRHFLQFFCNLSAMIGNLNRTPVKPQCNEIIA
jgi:hypothetical protein